MGRCEVRRKNGSRLDWAGLKGECLKFIEEVMEALHIPSSAYHIDDQEGHPLAKLVFLDSDKEGNYNMNEAIEYAYSQDYIRREMIEVDYFRSQITHNRGRVTNIVGDGWFPVYLESQKDINFFMYQREDRRGNWASRYMIYKIIKSERWGYEYPTYYQCVMNPNNTPTSVWCNVYEIKGNPIKAMEKELEGGRRPKLDFIYTPLNVKRGSFLNWDDNPWDDKK